MESVTVDFSDLVLVPQGLEHTVEVPGPTVDGEWELSIANFSSPRSDPTGVPGAGPSIALEEATLAEVVVLTWAAPTPPSLVTIVLVGDSRIRIGPHVGRVVLTSADPDMAADIESYDGTEIAVAGPVLGVHRAVCDGATPLLFKSTRTYNEVGLLADATRSQLGSTGIRTLTVPEGTTCVNLGEPDLSGRWVDKSELSVYAFAGLGTAPLIKSNRPITLCGIPASTTVQVDRAGVSRLTIGSWWTTPSKVEDVTFDGAELVVPSGVIDGLRLQDVDSVRLGAPESDELSDVENDVVGEFLASLEGHEHMSVSVTRVSGTVEDLVLSPGSTFAGERTAGVTVTNVRRAKESVVLGLAAHSLTTSSFAELREADQSELWIVSKARKAYEPFASRLREAKKDKSGVAVALVADRCWHLDRFARETGQSGHVLAITREAERDSRRATLSTTSRERVLLELSRATTRYGQRIGRPLLLGAAIMALLITFEVGPADLTDEEWWSAFGSYRIERLVEFMLPGVSWLGLDPYGGIYGIAAKLVSVLAIGSSIRTATRLTQGPS